MHHSRRTCRPTLPPVAALLALLALAACVGPRGDDRATHGPTGSGTAGAAALFDACPLLTPAEIASVVGQPPGPPERVTGRFAGTCKWPSADGANPQMVHVLVSDTRVASYEDYIARAQHAMGQTFKAGEYRKVDGIGDFAVWEGDAGSGALQVVARGRLLQVTAAAVASRPAQEVALALASLALPRLPPAR